MTLTNRIVVIALAICTAAACGRAIDKGTAPANSGANSSTFNSTTFNSSSGTYDPSQGTEAGSPRSTVQSAFNRLLPLLCQYDATCDEPVFGGMCPSATDYSQFAGDCWKVDETQLGICENELRGLQCQGQYENIPGSCQLAVQQCACKQGYQREWPDDAEEPACYPECGSDGSCSFDLQCYDGVCTPPQEGRCPDDQQLTFVNDEQVCTARCETDEGCDSGETCQSGLCIPEPTDTM